MIQHHKILAHVGIFSKVQTISLSNIQIKMKNISSDTKLNEKRSKFALITEARCPQCHKGKMFKYPFWRVNKFSEMNKNCTICVLRFELEPGFWFGSMYVSYVINIATLIIMGIVIFYFFDDPSLMYYVVPVTVVSLVSVPFNFRIARAVYLHLLGFVKYKPVE